MNKEILKNEMVTVAWRQLVAQAVGSDDLMDGRRGGMRVRARGSGKRSCSLARFLDVQR